MADVSVKFHVEAQKLSDFSAVGDAVILDWNESVNGNAIIHYVLSRKSAFI